MINPSPVIPSLPSAQIRVAIDAGDWQHATALLAGHHEALAAEIAATDLATTPHGPWLDLLSTQRAMLEELRVARDRVAGAIAQLGQDHRGARAWLRELA